MYEDVNSVVKMKLEAWSVIVGVGVIRSSNELVVRVRLVSVENEIENDSDDVGKYEDNPDAYDGIVGVGVNRSSEIEMELEIVVSVANEIDG